MTGIARKEKALDFFHLHLRKLTGFVFYLLSRSLKVLGRDRKSLAFLLASIRYSYNGKAIAELSRTILESRNTLAELVSSGVPTSEACARTIMLSPPQLTDKGLKKGVLLVTFTRTISYFSELPQLEKLNELFAFVLEPSWAGYADADILHFMLKTDHCIVQTPELADRAFINAIFPECLTVSFGAGNWVDDSLFVPRPIAKSYDAIYVANMNPIKRVFRFIDAVDNISRNNRGYRAKLVCASWGSNTSEQINAYLKEKNLSSIIEFSLPVSQDDLINLISSSKCSVLLSLKEGSSRILFESMFLDVPVLCLSENIGVNKAYINEYTGLLIPDAGIEAGLRSLSKSDGLFRPRTWAEINISPEVTTKHLSDALFMKFGRRVNSELLVKVNQPEVRYKQSHSDTAAMTEMVLGAATDPSSSLAERVKAIGLLVPTQLKPITGDLLANAASD